MAARVGFKPAIDWLIDWLISLDLQAFYNTVDWFMVTWPGFGHVTELGHVTEFAHVI